MYDRDDGVIGNLDMASWPRWFVGSRSAQRESPWVARVLETMRADAGSGAGRLLCMRMCGQGSITAPGHCHVRKMDAMVRYVIRVCVVPTATTLLFGARNFCDIRVIELDSRCPGSAM